MGCTDKSGLSTTKCRTVQNKAMGKPKIVASYKMGGETAKISATQIRDANAKWYALKSFAITAQNMPIVENKKNVDLTQVSRRLLEANNNVGNFYKYDIYAEPNQVAKAYKSMVIGTEYLEFMKSTLGIQCQLTRASPHLPQPRLPQGCYQGRPPHPGPGWLQVHRGGRRLLPAPRLQAQRGRLHQVPHSSRHHLLRARWQVHRQDRVLPLPPPRVRRLVRLQGRRRQR